MKMIDVLKNELKSDMSIGTEKELSSKWKVTILYNGMQSTIDLPKTCTPGCEKEVCRKAIDTALSTMYVNEGNLAEAKKWLDGEFWKNIDDESGYRRVNNDTWICNHIEDKLKQWKEKIKKSKSINHWEDQAFEDAYVMGMEEIISDIERILYQ